MRSQSSSVFQVAIGILLLSMITLRCVVSGPIKQLYHISFYTLRHPTISTSVSISARAESSSIASVKKATTMKRKIP